MGEAHWLKASPSRLHSKVEPVSEEEKTNVAEPPVVPVVPSGPESMVVSGGVVSVGTGKLVVKRAKLYLGKPATVEN